MDTEALKTIFFCSVFVFLGGSVGSIITIIFNAITIYIQSPTAKDYSALIKSELFASHHVPYYVLAGIIFAGIQLATIYMWKNKSSK